MGGMSQLSIINVTTTGAKSGLPRTTPLIAILDEQNPQQFALIASNWGHKHYPSWYYNVTANPRVTCTIKGETKDYTAAEVSGADYDRFWGYAKNTYVGYALYKERVGKRSIPIILLTPVQ